ncbi:hypothetical protein FOMPIDRAFT_1052548 [Fomitopsis schrenkii]|uniref:Uncharacterized protein n=1 Tax=Fomitopsis schrenkii TaxID=2126942 RepID=S8DXJ2_FOMSC|nr:hypothetical protein FOMPIDRAFT_1052548 [Fomitopsis schrenkii]
MADDGELPDWEKELEELAANLDFDGEDVLNEHTDNVEGLVNELDELDEDTRHAHLEGVCPIKLVLFKLQKISYAIHNSTTILAPAVTRRLVLTC